MTIWRPQSAYQILQPAERAFCDAIVREMESLAQINGHPIAVYLSHGFEVPSHITSRDTKGMMTRERIKNAVHERLSDLARESDITEQRWSKSIGSIAHSSMQNYCEFDDDGNFVRHRLDKCTPEQWAAIKSIEIDGDRVGPGQKDEMEVLLRGRPSTRSRLKIQLYDKLAALRMEGEYAGYLGTDNPAMRADSKKAKQTAIREGDTVDQAGDTYAAMLESQ